MQIHAKDKLARKVKSVMVDGVDVTKRCFYIDDEAGEAHCYKHIDGKAYLEGDSPATEILTGKIEIIFKKEQ